MHRDLKPDNLFIVRRSSDEGPEATLKVLDFGIAEVDPFRSGSCGRWGSLPEEERNASWPPAGPA